MLVLNSSLALRHAGPFSCVYGAAGLGEGADVCDALGLLAFLSVVASLIISVSQARAGDQGIVAVAVRHVHAGGSPGPPNASTRVCCAILRRAHAAC
jgi:hypothetical protein